MHQQLADGLYIVDAKQGFLGLELGARMTVMASDDGLLIHSPVADALASVSALGAPRWALAPNLFHHLHVGPVADAGIETWAAPGLMAKRGDVAFQGELNGTTSPFGDAFRVLVLRCFSMTNEVVVLHRPSRTLVVTDLVFHLTARAPWSSRFAMGCLGAYPGCRTSVLERVMFKRDVARRELETIASWDFDRLVMAHGEVIETGGKAALLRAFAWLGLNVPVPMPA